ncbi:MAG: transporter substrate-binding domain-containing protein [Peptococcaceae bacterium]|nr:transporter substrate-binding domain-containing protein [Peptococcaceae bacterium]
MKRIVYLLVAGVMLVGMMFAFTACNGNGGNDIEELVCGITDYEPMNYRDDQGEWTGFDTEFALMVGEKLGMNVSFQEIEWANKYAELNSGAIDCIWNGFTANTEDDGVPRSDLVDMSYGYMLNQQCIVIRTTRDREFRTESDLRGKSAAVEKGSAGENYAIKALGDNARIVTPPAQTGTLLEVKSGAVDFAVVDLLLAQKMTGVGDYTDLKIANITLDSEMYAIAFKKGSALTAKVNQAMMELYDDGKLEELAKKYKLENSLLIDKGTETDADADADADTEANGEDEAEEETETGTNAGSGTSTGSGNQTATETEKETDDDEKTDDNADDKADADTDDEKADSDDDSAS